MTITPNAIDRRIDQLHRKYRERDKINQVCNEKIQELKNILINTATEKIQTATTQRFVYREVVFHGHIVQDDQVTAEEPRGHMLILSTDSEFWIVMLDLLPSGDGYREFTSYASRFDLDFLDDIEKVWALMMRRPAA